MIITTIFDYRSYIHIITINIILYTEPGDGFFANKMAKENIETVLWHHRRLYIIIICSNPVWITMETSARGKNTKMT